MLPKIISVFCPAPHLNRVGISVQKASLFCPTSRPFLLPNFGQHREKFSLVGFCDSNGARGANNFGRHRNWENAEMCLILIVGSVLPYSPFSAYSVRPEKRTRHERERATLKMWQTLMLGFVSSYSSFLDFSGSRRGRFVSTEAAPS